jgi:UDP-N-acetylmuramoylalanine--D-glutamate ligase
VISEIEFAALSLKQLIGVTGSNGKTTTTMLTYHLLKSALNIGLGNIGKSFALQVANDTYDSILELSSFQLDGIVDYKPHIAIITNISRII